MEIITDIERWRRWRVEDRLRIIAKIEQPGACFADIARCHEVSRGLLRNWRNRVRRGTLRQTPAPSFLPVRVVNDASTPGRPPPVPAAAEGKIEITLPDGSKPRPRGVGGIPWRGTRVSWPQAACCKRSASFQFQWSSCSSRDAGWSLILRSTSASQARINVIRLGSLDQRIHGHCPLSAGIRTGEQP